MRKLGQRNQRLILLEFNELLGNLEQALAFEA